MDLVVNEQRNEMHRGAVIVIECSAGTIGRSIALGEGSVICLFCGKDKLVYSGVRKGC